MSSEPRKKLIASMAIRRQRLLLSDLGARVGTRVAFLKAAFADPVLYGGRGERSGVDVDVLVAPKSFEAFASALEQVGFVRQVHESHPVSAYRGKDWTFDAPEGFAQVDLHRALAVDPWFELTGTGPLDRAVHYDSVDGPILSLCPEDQVVFLAAHYCTHVFDLDDRHLEDVVKLLERCSVDWNVIQNRAREAFLSPALGLCVAALAARGVDVPRDLLSVQGIERWRRAWLARFVSLPHLERRIRMGSRGDILLVMPFLSSRPSALPRFMWNYTRGRVADAIAGARSA